jgi:hypothetical protein
MNIKQAKEHCGYSPKPVLPTCGNCGAFASEMKVPAWMEREFNSSGSLNIYIAGFRTFTTLESVPDGLRIESNLLCADHGFAIKKMASCKLWRAKSEPCHFVEQGDKDRGAISGR